MTVTVTTISQSHWVAIMVSIHRFAILSNKESSNSNSNNNNGSLGSINEIAHTRCSCFETNRPKLTESTARPTLFLSLSCANNINLATMRRSHDRAKAAVAVVLWSASPRAIVVGTVSTYRAAPLRRRHATHYHNHASVRCPLPAVRPTCKVMACAGLARLSLVHRCGSQPERGYGEWGNCLT